MLQVVNRKLAKLAMVLFMGGCLIIISGCASSHFVKMSSNFKNKSVNVKTIGFLAPMDYESNHEGDITILQAAIVESFQNNSPYRLKIIRQENFPGQWDSSIQRVASDSRGLLKEIELEGLWKDKKNDIISRKLFDDIKAFKSLDPELDALLLIKCKQHYGNAWMAGLYAFGAIGGLVAGATAEKDPVIGSHMPADNDTYSSALLVDLNTADILWYNFALRFGLNVIKEKDAKSMMKDMLFGLLN